MPQPSSVSTMRFTPPSSSVMRSVRAPASSAFSSNSLTTDAGRSTTSPAAIWLMSWSGSGAMARERRACVGGQSAGGRFVEIGHGEIITIRTRPASRARPHPPTHRAMASGCALFNRCATALRYHGAAPMFIADAPLFDGRRPYFSRKAFGHAAAIPGTHPSHRQVARCLHPITAPGSTRCCS